MIYPLRSAALLVCVLWLIVDLGLVIYRITDLGYGRPALFCFSAGLLFCLQLWIMAHWIRTDLKKQQEDIFKNLASETFLGNNDPANTRFYVRNGSSANVLLFEMGCLVKDSIKNNGTTGPTLQTGDIHIFHRFDPPVRMELGGTGYTDKCVQDLDEFRVIFQGKPLTYQCIDLVVYATYAPEADDESKRTKNFRWMGEREGETWNWFTTLDSTEGCKSKTFNSPAASSPPSTPPKSIPPQPSARDALHLALWRVQNDPSHLALYDLFLTDFKVLAVGRTQPFQRPGGSGSVMVERRVAYELATNTKFVMMYVPSVEDTYGICSSLATTIKPFLEEAGNLQAIGKAGIKPPGDSDKESMSDAVFSGRVFIYTEWLLTAEQIGQLTKIYSDQNLKLLIRGSEYLDYQKLEYSQKNQ